LLVFHVLISNPFIETVDRLLPDFFAMISPIFLFRVVFAGHCTFRCFMPSALAGVQLWKMKQQPDTRRMIRTHRVDPGVLIDLERHSQPCLSYAYSCLLV
jgi:hypothetical protein